MADEKDFKNTVFLPKTDFPMKANLPSLEPSILNAWSEVYEKLQVDEGKKVELLWGPPFANGHLHMGTSLNGILKDILMKTKRMQGYYAPLVPIWDCHGLPIEWKVEEQEGKLNPIQMIAKCREFAAKWMNIQKEEFKRLGILADFDHALSTMDKDFESLVVSQLFHMLMRGQIKRGLKPVLWSVVEQTALAEAEVEYHEHESTAVFVAFDIVSDNKTDSAVVIWTTTPWTLPSNRAVAYKEDIEYVLLEPMDKFKGKKFWISKDLLNNFLESIECKDFKVSKEMLGKDFSGLICNHPIYNFTVPLIPSDHVTNDAGTGFVHIAPSHGLEDFELGKKFNLEIPELVKGDGCYASNVEIFAGIHIFKVTGKILDSLGGNLLKHYKMNHSYPHSWRSRAPLIYRTTSQWFVDLTEIQSKALNAIEDVNWHPTHGKNRIGSMVGSRKEWCLSRQRTWGVPIPFFVDKETNEVLKNDILNGKIVSIIKNHGIEGWRSHSKEEILSCIDVNPDDFDQVFDIVDVWFESGCVHMLKNKPADYYLEGSDQHRGWFQSSLLVACSNQDFAPYKNVLTHGFVLDGKGRKMSKSLGNTIHPKDLVETKGADIIRLWVANSNYTDDLCISDEILSQQEDIYRKFRNVLRYLLGAIESFDLEEPSELFELDKYILHKMREVDQKRDTLNFYEFYSSLHDFCSFDLSAFYFDIKKDTLYCDSKESIKRKANQFVLLMIFKWLCHVLAPVLSFTADEAWSYYLKKFDQPISSIHLNKVPKIPGRFKDVTLAQRFEIIRSIRKSITTILERKRASKEIGSSLQAHIDIYSKDPGFINSVDWAEVCIISSFSVLPYEDGFEVIDDQTAINMSIATGFKCKRCWKITKDEICKRCSDVLTQI